MWSESKGIIAIDYDDTWTRDPVMWIKIVRLMKNCGWRVIIATGRKQWSDDMKRGMIPDNITIVFCGNNLKQPEVKRQLGEKVAIWIDDMPGMIQNCKILDDDI